MFSVKINICDLKKKRVIWIKYPYCHFFCLDFCFCFENNSTIIFNIIILLIWCITLECEEVISSSENLQENMDWYLIYIYINLMIDTKICCSTVALCYVLGFSGWSRVSSTRKLDFLCIIWLLGEACNSKDANIT